MRKATGLSQSIKGRPLKNCPILIKKTARPLQAGQKQCATDDEALRERGKSINGA